MTMCVMCGLYDRALGKQVEAKLLLFCCLRHLSEAGCKVENRCEAEAVAFTRANLAALLSFPPLLLQLQPPMLCSLSLLF